MIIVRLTGGLGNQIFQLGAGLLLAKNAECKTIIIDDSTLASYEARRINQLVKFFDFTKTNISIIFKQSFISKFRLPKLLPFNLPNYPLVSDKNFQTVLKNPNKNLWLDGYFQDCLTQKIFNEEIDILKPLFVQKELSKQEGCVIHIRGGDFVSLGWDKVAPPMFYMDAIHKMRQEHGVEKFCVVTDDKKYAATVLKEFDFSFISGGMEEDFNVIGQFQFRILSSSTFALWASILGSNGDNSVVIAPDKLIPTIERNFLLPSETRMGL